MVTYDTCGVEEAGPEGEMRFYYAEQSSCSIHRPGCFWDITHKTLLCLAKRTNLFPLPCKGHFVYNVSLLAAI